MKNLLYSLFALVVLTTGCSDDDATPKVLVEETPFSTYLNLNSDLSLETISGSYSLGYEFKSSASGKVKALGLTAPHSGTFTVQLYKVDSIANTGTLVAEAEVTLTDAEVASASFGYTALTEPAVLLKNEYYRVAYSEPENLGFYRLHEQEGHSLPFKQTDSFIKVTKGVYGNINEYPLNSWNVLYTADVRLEFTK